MSDAVHNDATGESPWSPFAQQAVFRALMRGFANPGRVETVSAGDDGLIRVLATLVDAEVDLADPDGLVRDADRVRLGCAGAAPEAARFVLARGERPPAFDPALGTLESPERGATVILRVARLGQGRAAHAPAGQAGLLLGLSGPGVHDSRTLRVWGLDAEWLAARERWNAAFPLGCDWILSDGGRIAALPRTTRIVRAVEEGGEH